MYEFLWNEIELNQNKKTGKNKAYIINKYSRYPYIIIKYHWINIIISNTLKPIKNIISKFLHIIIDKIQTLYIPCNEV